MLMQPYNEKKSYQRSAAFSILKLIDRSTCHGIANIVRSDNILIRLTWIISFIVSVSICACLVTKSIINYYNYEYVTNVDFVFEHPTMFPTITFCSCSFKFDNRSLSQIIISCIFNNNDSCKTNLNDSFESFKDPRYGTCYRFNSGKNMMGNSINLLTSNLAGRSGGLQMEVNETNGLLIFVHNYTNSPYFNENYNNLNGYSLFVSTGYSTDLNVDRIFIQRLEQPYNDCFKNVTFFNGNKTIIDYILKRNRTYTQQECVNLCFDLNYIKTNPCNCSNVSIGKVWQKCFTEKEKENKSGCTIKYKSKFNNLNQLDFCSDYCPLECDSIVYNTYSTFHLTENESKSNTLKFKVYYRDYKYMLIDQQPKTDMIVLISEIGGVLGLFLGVSFLSFIEIIEVGYLILLFMIGSLNGNNKK